jgi:hypothetical protein
VLELHGPGGLSTVINDNWRDDPVQEAAILAGARGRGPSFGPTRCGGGRNWRGVAIRSRDFCEKLRKEVSIAVSIRYKRVLSPRHVGNGVLSEGTPDPPSGL